MRQRSFFLLLCVATLASTGAHAVMPSVYLKPADAVPINPMTIAKQDPDQPVALSADEMAMDQPSGIVIARGNVEVMQGDSILTAKQITYFQKTDMVVAEGDVSVLQPSGDVFFSDRAVLKDAMKRAVISQFKARFADGSVLVADRAIKHNSEQTELRKASYTPCNLCPTAAPFWQMNAGDAFVDNMNERVTYHNAFMEIMGVPVAYTPYLSHPTPDARGKSGFLTPTYATNANLGALVKVPYYWRIGEDRDVVLTPWMTMDQGPVMQWDYNQLRNTGKYSIRGSVTYPKRIDDAGRELSGNELRGHLFAQGDELVADNTHVGFDIQHTSDETYLRRYSFGDQQALFSRLYAEYARGRNFALAEGVAIQGLRSTDNQKTTPLVLPTLQGYYETPAAASGLKFHVAADAQMLTREQGVDQRRLSVTPGATLPYVTDGGQVYTLRAGVRQDVYVSDNVVTGGGGQFSGTTTRTIPQASLEWRLPLINPLPDATWLVEPIVLGVVQPTGNNPDKISNEDSRLIELNDTNLFSAERMPGLDLVDSGSRLAYGLRSQYSASDGMSFEGMLGQSYSFNSDTPFPNSTKEGEQFSDYIGRLGASYDGVALAYRFALDQQQLELNRNELSVTLNKPWLSLYSSYYSLKNNRYLKDSQEGLINATLPLSDEWSLYGNARRDLENDFTVTAGGGIIYKNECFTMMLDGLRIFTRDRDIEPTTQFTFRVGFKNLGEFGGI
jgi:LPS-assembly protein